MGKEFDGTLAVVPRSSIIVSERFRKNYGDIDKFAAGIAEDGLINPLTVRDLGDSTYELVAGGRRITALDKLQYTEVPIRIFPRDTDELTFRILELKENLDRKDMEWHEIVESKKNIHELYIQKFGAKTSRFDTEGHSLRDTAKLLGESVGSVSQDIELARKIEMVPALRNLENKSKAVQAVAQAGRRVATAETLTKLLAEAKEKPEDQQKQKLISSYVIADFFAGAKNLPNEYFDFVDLDPPYGINFNNPGSLRDIPNRSDFVEVGSTEYAPLLAHTLKECYRMMRPNSWLILWHASEPWAEVTYQAIIAAGFTCSRYAGIWKKGIQKGFAPDLRGRLSQSYEPFYYARKGDPGFTSQGRSAIFDFEPVVAGNKIHPTEKPVTLMQEILQTFTVKGARVLIPFAGSGNTILAANNYTCEALGFDLSQQYKDDFTRRVLSGTLGAF